MREQWAESVYVRQGTLWVRSIRDHKLDPLPRLDHRRSMELHLLASEVEPETQPHRRRSPNLIGQRFGRLTVEQRGLSRKVGKRAIAAFWWCRCDCGTVKEIQTTRLTTSAIRSCGCLLREVSGARITQFNHSRKGTVSALPPKFQDETLAALRAIPGATFEQLCQQLHIGKHTLWARLRKLSGLGMVHHDDSRPWRWFSHEA